VTLGKALAGGALCNPRPVPGLIVMKFGGTSVADAGRIKRAARRIVDKREAGTASWRCSRPAARRPTS